jgi:hypothetical protein
MVRKSHDCKTSGHVFFTTFAGDRVCQVCSNTVRKRADPSMDMEGKVGSDHPSTSMLAAQRILPASGTQRQNVLDELLAIFPDGMTDEEIQDELAMNANAQRPRRLELVEQGWVEDSGKRRKTVSGLDAIVWQYKVLS